MSEQYSTAFEFYKKCQGNVKVATCYAPHTLNKLFCK